MSTHRKLKKRPASREEGATTTSLAQRPPMPARFANEESGRPKTKMPTPGSGDQSSEASPDSAREADDCARIMAMLGTTDLAFVKGIYAQLMSASARADGRYDAVGLFFSLAAIKGKKPKTEFQAMLAAQAAVTHVLTMKSASRLGQAEDLAAHDSAERAFNKLARTFVMQLEAINRFETSGEQKVTVQNVSVSDGGQAIVGNVTQGAPDKPAKKRPALTNARQAPMPIIETPVRPPVPVSRNNDKSSSA